MNEDEKKNGKLGYLLSDYVSVWLWVILFGGLSGVSYLNSVIWRFNLADQLSSYIMAIIVLASIVVIIGWINLYLFLVRYLIPRFILKKEIEDEKTLKKISSYITNIFAMFIISIGLRLILEIIQFLTKSDPYSMLH